MPDQIISVGSAVSHGGGDHHCVLLGPPAGVGVPRRLRGPVVGVQRRTVELRLTVADNKRPTSHPSAPLSTGVLPVEAGVIAGVIAACNQPG